MHPRCITRGFSMSLRPTTPIIPHMALPRYNLTVGCRYKLPLNYAILRPRSVWFFRPTIFSHSLSGAISTWCTNAFLLVVSISSTPATSDVSCLLTASHWRCSLRHMFTTINAPPTSPLWNKRKENYSSSSKRFLFFPLVRVVNIAPIQTTHAKLIPKNETIVCPML